MWDRNLDTVDWLIVLGTLLLAFATLWVASYPVVDTDGIFAGMFAWSIVAFLWAARLLATANDPFDRGLAFALVVAALVSNPIVPFGYIAVGIGGAEALAVGVLIGLALLGTIVLRSRSRRVTWVIAPAMVLVTFAILVSGIPRITRMALAEPALTNFARSFANSQTELPAYFDDGVSVGSIPIYAVYEYDGALRFITGTIGWFDGYEAGIAYFPDGPPAAARYEHLFGAWYRWYD